MINGRTLVGSKREAEAQADCVGQSGGHRRAKIAVPGAIASNSRRVAARAASHRERRDCRGRAKRWPCAAPG